MKKYVELLKNIGILTLSNFGSKLLSFLLVPLYTSVLSTEEYGNFDFINVTISLLIPLLTLNISEGALRFLLDSNRTEKEKNDITSITCRYAITSTIIVIIFSVINYKFNFISILKENFVFFIVFYLVSVMYQSIQNLTRGYDRLSDIAIAGIINSIFMIFLNILFLLVFKIGLLGYFLASIVSTGISTIFLMCRLKILKKIYNKTNKIIERKMITYSKPLMLNSIGWWITNISDRYIITFMCGISENGIYSVAYKIPSILSIIQNIVNQAWTISAVKNINCDKDNKFVKNVYSFYNFLMVICCSSLIILTKILAKMLYNNEFYNAWRYMPFLLISIVFGALSGLLGGLFSAEKNTKILGYTTIGGAIINIVLNFILINNIGPMGAAISTAISYCVVWIIRIIVVEKKYKIKLNIKRDLIAYIILIIQSVIILELNKRSVMYGIEIVLFAIEILLFYNDIINFIKNKLIMIKKQNI